MKSARADELNTEELLAGGERLRQRVLSQRPNVLAILGITAYRAAFQQSKAKMGLQPETIGDTKLWVLPNPSGLNAHHTLDSLANLFRQLYDFAHPKSP